MAMTSAERQARRRERLRQEQKVAPEQTDAFLSSAFSEYLQQHDEEQVLSFIAETLDSVGLHQTVSLTKNVDPEFDDHPDWQQFGIVNRGSLGRAERMVDALIDSAKALAEAINRYKTQEIEAAIRKLESKKLSSAAAQKKALNDMVRLNAIHARLKREVRHSFATSTVKEG